jgi:hypothetical protein
MKIRRRCDFTVSGAMPSLRALVPLSTAGFSVFDRQSIVEEKRRGILTRHHGYSIAKASTRHRSRRSPRVFASRGIFNKGNNQKGKRMDMNCHPATSGSSHLLEGVSLRVSVPEEIRNRLNCQCFLRDFGSVPGSHIVQYNHPLSSFLYNLHHLIPPWPMSIPSRFGVDVVLQTSVSASSRLAVRCHPMKTIGYPRKEVSHGF